LVEIRFKAPPPGTSDSPLISPSFSSEQCNRAYWASQTQKSVTFQPQPGGGRETTKSERTCGGIGKKKKFRILSGSDTVNVAGIEILSLRVPGWMGKFAKRSSYDSFLIIGTL